MSKAYKCDVCGTLFEIANYTRVASGKYSASTGGAMVVKELCSECEAKLVALLNGEDGEDEENA